MNIDLFNAIAMASVLSIASNKQRIGYNGPKRSGPPKSISFEERERRKKLKKISKASKKRNRKG